jgi:hypothetical protein
MILKKSELVKSNKFSSKNLSKKHILIGSALTVIAGTLIFAASLALESKFDSQTVARVGNHRILKEDLERATQRLISQLQQDGLSASDVREAVLNSLIEKKIFYQLALDMGMKATEMEINQEIKNNKIIHLGPSFNDKTKEEREKAWDELLKRAGYDKQSYRQGTRELLSIEKFLKFIGTYTRDNEENRLTCSEDDYIACRNKIKDKYEIYLQKKSSILEKVKRFFDDNRVDNYIKNTIKDPLFHADCTYRQSGCVNNFWLYFGREKFDIKVI